MNIHVIPHTHWDREWYFNTGDSKSLLIYFMDELINTLETNEEFKYFILDGQAIILDDYLELVPENRNRVKKLVNKGKLIIGPWYTQTDNMVVSGESIVRNLYYGIKACEQFGEWMKVGYIPDSFGQSEQLPQILKGFDIDKVVFWRGMYEKKSPYSEFFWESPNGSKVFAVNLSLGYAIGKYLPHDVKEAKEKIARILSAIDIKAISSNVIIPNGHDQMPVQKDLPIIIEGLNRVDEKNNYFISNFENYIDSVRKENQNFDIVEGELIYPKYMRVHRSIYSTRYDIKKLNVQIENYIVNLIEPLLAMAWKLGLLYPKGIMEKIWKIMFQCQAHDSIGCCNTDEVNNDIKNRLLIAKELCNGIFDINIRKISEAIKPQNDGQPIVIFNMLPYERNNVFITNVIVEDENFNIIDEAGNAIPYEIIYSEEVDMGTIDRRIAASGKKLLYKKCNIAIKPDFIPAFGYDTYYIVKNANSICIKTVKKNIIENEYFKIEANLDGTLNITDKCNGKYFSEVFLIENSGDDGDEYNYSPPEDDFVITNKGHTNASIYCEKGNLIQMLKINMILTVPHDIEERRQKKSSVDIPIEIKMELKKGCRNIDVKIEINNKARDTRFRLLLKTDIPTKFSYADEQFGTIKRPNTPDELNVWEEDNWQEKPLPIYPMQSFVDINNDCYGISIITNGLREYEITGEKYDTIAITLFRSVGFIGKPDLINRPGRASGVPIKTEASQMQTALQFEFRIYTHNGDVFMGKTALEAKDYLTPLVSYQITDYVMFVMNKSEYVLPSKKSLLSLESDSVVSVIKKAEDIDGILIRLFNPSTNQIDGGILTANYDIAKSIIVNLREQQIDTINREDNCIKIDNFKPCEIKSILIE